MVVNCPKFYQPSPQHQSQCVFCPDFSNYQIIVKNTKTTLLLGLFVLTIQFLLVFDIMTIEARHRKGRTLLIWFYEFYLKLCDIPT